MNIRIRIGEGLRKELVSKLQKAIGQDGRLAQRVLSILEIVTV